MGSSTLSVTGEPKWFSGYRQKNKTGFESFSTAKKPYFFSPKKKWVDFSPGGSDARAPVELEKKGVRVLSWEQAFNDKSLDVKSFLEKESPQAEFEWFVNAFFNAGFVLVIDNKTDVSAPLEWTFSGKKDVAYKVLIVVKESVSGVAWIEHLKGNFEGGYFQSIVLEDNANASFVRLFDVNADGFVSLQSFIGKDASLSPSNGFLNARELKCSVANHLTNSGGKVSQRDVCFGSGKAGFDVLFSNNHRVGNCFSRCVFKGVFLDASNAAFDGMIRIFPNAQQSDALLECHGMLLSKSATANIIPGLEILADDVKATHSASVAHVDEDAIFYLESKGIPRQECEKMIVSGFLESVANELSPLLRERVLGLLEEKIAARLEESHGQL